MRPMTARLCAACKEPITNLDVVREYDRREYHTECLTPQPPLVTPRTEKR